MTGEITLRGRVLGVGGIKEKAVAALREGIRHVLLPVANENDLEELPNEVLEGLRFHPVRDMDQVVEAALVERPSPRPGLGSDLLGSSPDPGVTLSQ